MGLKVYYTSNKRIKIVEERSVKEVKYFCDICGKEILDARYYEIETEGKEFPHYTKDIICCKECAEKRVSKFDSFGYVRVDQIPRKTDRLPVSVPRGTRIDRIALDGDRTKEDEFIEFLAQFGKDKFDIQIVSDNGDDYDDEDDYD